MLEMAQEAGTTDIVATPHANSRYAFDSVAVRSSIESLQRRAPGPIPRLHYGCDFRLSFDNLRAALERPELYTINHGRYLLVEFPDLAIPPNSGEILERLIQRGLVPVITHPERNELLRQRMAGLKSWVEMGCLLQLTAGSVTGRFGKSAERFCEALFGEGLAHIVASDAHDTVHRTPDMREARGCVRSGYGEDLARRVFETVPRAVIDNRALPDESGAGRTKRRRLWFW
jgi:protein-tyrosine phosphatase